MQFKHPEILYALLLLIIPILVHLFQLQRFVKVPFTNVKILKNIEQQTRKSARLKKWLVLTARLVAFACLILAFAQPYLSKLSTQQNIKTILYLDNSFSMQANGENGELLKSVAQNIIENLSNQNTTISFITNDKSLKELDFQNLKNELITLKYSTNKLDLNTVLLKANNLESINENTVHELILMSDFQNINLQKNTDFTTKNTSIHLVKLSPKKSINIFIDSVYSAVKNETEITINAIIKSTQNTTVTIPVSLFNNSKLIGKTTSIFENSNSTNVQFTIPNSIDFRGNISLIDDYLEFDNDFYFSISKPEKINVLNIGNTAEFLRKIYTENEFNFTTSPLQNLNYNTIQNQQLILLNEIDLIPNELGTSLKEYAIKGGNIVVIPSENTDINSYNTFLNLLSLGKITSKIEDEHKITTINYDHPLLKDVFEKHISNFQYPTTKIQYQTNLFNSSSILKLDNNQPFISSIENKLGTFYWIASPLNKEISDFTQSSLIVPVFYNFAKHSLKTSILYYIIEPETAIEIKATIGKDDVLKISNETNEFIPLQTISQNKVTIQLQNQISQSGFYDIKSDTKILKTIAFNYNREESDLASLNLKDLIANQKNVTISSSIDEVFNEINNQQKINWLFKWFLAFSVLFLLIEMLILKYFNK